MTHNRFIELVNLYVDRQISAGETAELEAEIQASPRRREIYHQYCQIHVATKQVYDSFRAQGSDQAAPRTAGADVITRFGERRSTRRRWNYVGGSLAAAAALALAVVRFGSFGAPMAVADSKATPAPATALVATTATPASSGVKATLVPVQAVDRAELQKDYAAMVEALRRADERIAAHTPLAPAQPRSLFDDGVFDSQSGSTANARTFRAGAPSQTATTESIAFQFRR